MATILERLRLRRRPPRAGAAAPSLELPGEQATPNSERGRRTTPENQLRYLYQAFWVDPARRAAILDIRDMDRKDNRIKKIHSRTAAAVVRGGLKLKAAQSDQQLHDEWQRYARRLDLHRFAKLKSDARGLMMEGTLALQWVLDGNQQVAGAVRMPSETIVPLVGEHGRFQSLAAAYRQVDVATGRELATFALWQLTLERLDPDNYDDQGAMGRPYLDANREIWRKLRMTEEDLVIRRRTRAPMRTAHTLEGASTDELETYRQRVEGDEKQITTNYYSNKKGAVQAVQGDANLDQIADVHHLLDTFFAGAPAPKGLFGYPGDLTRDILEDLKRDYFEELECMQEALAGAYRTGFELHLLLRGINPLDHTFEVCFAERRTETPNQAADRGLKVQAAGASQRTTLEVMGLDPDRERARLEDEVEGRDPYPRPHEITPQRRVSITPGNARKGESATAVSN